jgi:hypothetical protein
MASSSPSLLGRLAGKLSLMASSLTDAPAGKLSSLLSASEALGDRHAGSESSMME